VLKDTTSRGLVLTLLSGSGEGEVVSKEVGERRGAREDVVPLISTMPVRVVNAPQASTSISHCTCAVQIYRFCSRFPQRRVSVSTGTSDI
jgi:hypothetical protein